MNAIRLASKISAQHVPNLHRFLDQLDLRSVYARLMFGRLIEKALMLTPADRARYDALMLAFPRTAKGRSKPRHFAALISEQEMPHVYALLRAAGYEAGLNPNLLSELEIAAGLLVLDAKLIEASARTVGGDPAASVSVARQVPEAPPPHDNFPAPTMPPAEKNPSPEPVAVKPIAPEVFPHHDIVSSSMTVPEESPFSDEDINELFGTMS